MIAAAQGDLDLVTFLCDHGADVSREVEYVSNERPLKVPVYPVGYGWL
jgi:ankyrin repeat protein